MIDIVERFTLALMLVVVAFRNLIELSGSSFNFSEGFALPKSFGWFRGNSVLWTVSYVSDTIYSAERSDIIVLTLITACYHGHGLRNASGLAQTCFYNEV
jgi:hypothetical protein